LQRRGSEQKKTPVEALQACHHKGVSGSRKWVFMLITGGLQKEKGGVGVRREIFDAEEGG